MSLCPLAEDELKFRYMASQHHGIGHRDDASPKSANERAWFVGKTLSRNLVGDHLVYLLAPVSVWAPDSSDDLLYLSDVDEIGIDFVDEEPRKTFWKGVDVARKYGLRFTLDPRAFG